MLKAKVLSEILSQVNSGGVTTTLVFSKEGRLLSSATLEEKDVKTIAALASGIWQSFDNYGKLVLETSSTSMSSVFFECQSGCALVASLANVLLCLHCPQSVVEPGLLMLKLKACREFLEKPLLKLSPP